MSASTPSISNCYVSGEITVDNPETTIASDADVLRTANFAGIVGLANGDITGCVNEANITDTQVAASDTTVALNPSVAGIVASHEIGSVTNYVNGNEAKTTGAIKYLDNQAAQIYTPHVAGIIRAYAKRMKRW